MEVMRIPIPHVILCGLVVTGLGGSAAAQSAEHAALAVLEARCVGCHNAHDHKGDLVLDRGPLALENPRLLLDSVSGPEPEMPKDRDPLGPGELAALRDWVEAGTPIPEGRILRDTHVADRDWWSLRPLREPEVPEAREAPVRREVPGDRIDGEDQTKWARNPVDRFVLAKLKEQGLTPSPEADPPTLLRRLSYNLTGLPPTAEERRDFLREAAADQEAAYQNLVECLLASPRYGEHWGRLWLDVARYGESHGYDKDKARFNAWPYRDYVIRSFNADKPWARFVREQVAGDVLFPGEPDGIVALGFVAAGPWDFIAHHEVGEAKLDGRIAKHLDRDDMVSAVFNAFLSTTVQCAQCHNHKFDPVSMEDYYRLQAVFAGVDRADRSYQTDPEIAGQRAGIERELATKKSALKELDAESQAGRDPEIAVLGKQIATLDNQIAATLKRFPEHGYHSRIEPRPDTGKWVRIELAQEAAIAEIRLIAAYDDYADIGPGFGFPPRFRVEIADDPEFTENVRVLADHTDRDFPNPGIAPVIIDAGGQRARFLRVTATRLAERQDDFIFALAEARVLDEHGENLARQGQVTALDSIQAPPRWRRSNLIDGRFTRGANPNRVSERARLQARHRQLLADLETPEIREKRQKLTTEIDRLEKSLAALDPDQHVFALATRFKPEGKFHPTNGTPREIRLLHRGDLRNPGEIMDPGAPALWKEAAPVFGLPDDHSEGDRRAALAEYLTDPANPLLWRSAANRVWLGHMGRGIVDSPNDFGRMGMAPTHPELLDWLACRLRDTGSVKELHRAIVLSATYRQASIQDPAATAIDDDNQFYGRMNRRRLRAEELRDSILAAAGALDLRTGGPSFRDFKFKDDHTPKYHYHLHDPTDPDTHRRTVYRFIARSQTQPFLTTLDCADPSQMVAKRDETTTPLQALALMNNPFVTAMSKSLAENHPSPREMFTQAIGRPPTPMESDLLTNYHQQHGPQATARLLFNLNEFVYVD